MTQQMTFHLCLLLLSIPAASSNLGLEDVFFSPQDQTVREGEGVFFQCVSGESSPPASISWLKDGEGVTRGQQIQGEFGGGHQKKTSGTLHLLNVTSEDDGKYVCVTRNPSLNISSKSKPAQLTVLRVPRRLQIVRGPDNATVAMGTEASMHCAVRGFPVPMVHWFKNGDHLTNCSALCRLQNGGQLLVFRNVTREDAGSYHCEASNQRETVKSRPAFLILAEMDWSFVQQPLNLTVKTGENVTVTCRPPHSRPAAQVSWFKDNRLLAQTPRVTLLPSGDLFFHSVQESDGGSYFCRASNIHLQRFLSSRRATLTVLAPPSVTLWPQLLTVPVGARVVLECQVSGHPLPSISWIKRGHVRQTGGKVSLGPRNATLRFHSARSYDEGVYVCEASNALGHSQGAATLRVAVSPIIVNYVGQVSCRVGTPVVLSCRAVGILPITYTWTRGRTESQTPVRFSGGRHVDEEGALHISSVQRSDGGEYYCAAENRAGRHQRRTILTVTDRPADSGEQTRLVVSASINTTREVPTHQPNVQSQHKEASCSSFICDATTHGASTASGFSIEPLTELKVSHRSPGSRSGQHLIHLRPSQTQLSVTLTQHPPPSLPSFQSVDHHTQLQATGASLFSLTVVSQTTESSVTQPTSKLQVDGPFGFLDVDSYSQSLTRSLVTQPMMSHSGTVIQSHVSQPQSHQSVTQRPFYKSNSEKSSTLVPHTKLGNLSHASHLQHSSTLSKKPQPHHHRSFTSSYLPKFHQLLANEPHLLATQLPPSAATPHPFQVHSQSSPSVPPSDVFTLPQTQPQPPPAQNTLPSISTIHPDGQTSNPTTPNSEFPVVPWINKSERANVTLQSDPTRSASSSNNTELIEWLKRNTSQSPMTSNDPRVMQHSPSWLPVVEKHDIPIVVGVGVSLAFIFITVTFYSVVQKNEPAPTSRAAQRNLGVPVRHAERRAAGRTYENRAFEDDDCVAVIEQSPNTSDTRARPPGPSLVTVQMEPTSEDLQDDMRPPLDNHSITVEMYPEPILDTKIDPFLDEEKGCSLSQPSIQVQCDEDWTSNMGDSRSPCPDALPPPSSLPSRSPSPSPPSKREERLHSSLTLQSPEQCVPPIHHSLSISHGNPPLLLSHHVSVGLTTVAVDVHFYPAATASMTVGTSTHINSVPSSSPVVAPLFTPPLANSREAEQSAGRFHECK